MMSATRLITLPLCILATLVAITPTTPAAAKGDKAVVFAGNGEPGATGDGGQAEEAAIGDPAGLAVSEDGTVYIADAVNAVVRAVSPEGVITTVAGSGEIGIPETPIPDGTPATEIDLSQPGELAIGPDGTLYIADAGLRQVLGLNAEGALWLVAGSGEASPSGDGGQAAQAGIGTPGGLAVSSDKTVYIGDVANQYVRAVAADATIATVAGNGEDQVTAPGGDAQQVSVPFPTGLAVDGEDRVWIAAAGGLLLCLDDSRISTAVSSPKQEWSLQETADGAQPPINNLVSVAAGDDGLPYALNGQDGSVLRLAESGVLETVAEFPAPVSGQLAVSDSLYTSDLAGHQVYTAEAAGAQESSATQRYLPYAIGGGVVVLLLAGWLLLRRRPRA